MDVISRYPPIGRSLELDSVTLPPERFADLWPGVPQRAPTPPRLPQEPPPAPKPVPVRVAPRRPAQARTAPVTPDPSDVALARVIAQVHATLNEQHPWRADAACRGMTDRFFAPRPGGRHGSHGPAIRETEAARTVCAGCPVIDQCRAHLADIQAATLHGVWAGTSWRDRRGRNKRTA